MQFAQVDIFDGSELYSMIFDFLPTNPLNDNFDLLGISTSTFLLNSGSYFVFFWGIIGQFCLIAVFNKICTYFPTNRRFRNLGVFLRTQEFNLPAALTKLVLETYIDMVLASFLMIFSFLEDYRGEFLFSLHFSTFADGLNSTIGMIYIFVVLGLLFAVRSKSKQIHQQRLINQKKAGEVAWVFFDGIRLDTLDRASYNYFYLMRRFITAFVLIGMEKSPFFQCVFLLALSTINICYLVATRPLKDSSENKIELANEFTICFASHLLTYFLDVSISPKFIDYLGWIFMGILSVNIFFNLVVVVCSTFDKIRKIYLRHKREKQINEREAKLIKAKEEVLE